MNIIVHTHSYTHHYSEACSSSAIIPYSGIRLGITLGTTKRQKPECKIN